jgi:myo-inositol-1(or 4)-monophosphatase
MVIDDIESVARDVVTEAGERVRSAAQHAKHIHYKGAVDLVTETDREVEALVVGRLRQSFPDHVIMGEEASEGTSPQRPRPTEYAWYLDPLDGTTNFAHGFPHFAVSLALARGSDLLLGMVHDPMRGETFSARRGGGAALNGRAIRVSTRDDLGHSLLATGFPYDRREHTDFYVGFFADFLHQARDVRRAGAAALDLCYVACGRFDGFWEWKLRPWDTAAGALIVREAGGTVTAFLGETFDPFGEQTLASNGRIHAAMVRVLRTRLAAV